MIANFLANNPYFWSVLAVLWQIAELYLGLKKPMDAGSLPQLLYRLLQRVFSRKSTQKGAPPMPSANPNVITISVTVDKPTYDALGVVVSLINGIAAGQKPQEALTNALPAIMGSFGQLGQIPGDLVLDRASVIEAVSQRLGDLVEAFVLAKTSPVIAPALAPTK